MPLSIGHLSRLPRAKMQQGTAVLGGFVHGLNTADSPFQIAPTEVAECVNWSIQAGGRLVSRPPLIQYSNSATTSNSPVIRFKQAPIAGTNYSLLVDANSKIYYLDGNLDPTAITGTLDGSPAIVAYNGVVVLLDGGYIKYLDGVTAVKMAYDTGTGTTGYQFDNTAGTDDSSLALGNGTNIRVAYKFTSQSWTSGYTIPPTTIRATLSKTLAPTGTIVMKLRLVSDDSVLATKTFLADVSTLTGVATEYSATFASSDVSTEMSPSIDYYCSLEYAAGDAANYVNVHCTDVASGGVAYHYIADWNANATKDAIMALRPGRPPKGNFGDILGSRLFVGGDPDNPGWVWYGNLTYLDWSTSDGGGYVGAVDADSNNFPVGAIRTLYGDLYIFGTEDQPYLCKLEGATPSDFALTHIFQGVWGVDDTLVNTGNDLWYANGTGVNSMAGVEEYGDIRISLASEPIEDRIEDHWDSATAISGYYPKEGQYFLCMPEYYRVLVGHTKWPATSPSGLGLRHPWSEYEFYRDILTSSDYRWTASGGGTNEYYMELAAGGDPSLATQPDTLTLDGAKITEGTAGGLNDHEWDYGDNDALGYNTVYFRDESGDPDTTGVEIRSILIPASFAHFDNAFYVGGSDGLIYKSDSYETTYKELTSHQIKPKITSAYLKLPFRSVGLDKYEVGADAYAGAELDITVYRDGFESAGVKTWTHTLAASDALTLADVAGIDLMDAMFLLSRRSSLLWQYIHAPARSFQVKVVATRLVGFPLYLAMVNVLYRPLEL